MNLKTNIYKQDRAVALVITLLMLSVITFLAIAFISMTKRDRSAVTATLDVDTARSMSDAALSRAQTEIVAQMMAQTDILSYNYLASHNYISSSNFNTSEGFDSNNVNYDSLINNGGMAANPQNWAQNIANLLYDPRPPVFVMINGNLSQPQYDFRFWVDINRNGRFETNGYQPVLQSDGITPVVNNGVTVINFNDGEPEWIGVLKYPEYPHSATNPFVGRYAYMVLPIGKTLDLNYIHNDSKYAVNDVTSTTFNQDGFSRDEGVGSWELNLAALLENLGPAMYFTNTSVGPYYYALGGANTGGAFYDAAQFLSYRYGHNAAYPSSLSSMFSNVPIFWEDVDQYGADPSISNPFDFNAYTNAHVNPVTQPWPGSYNSNMFYDVQDFFDTNKTGNITATGNFYTRLTNTLGKLDTTNRYTFQRLLDCIGMSSQPEYGVYVYSNVFTNVFPTTWPYLLRTKVNINYDNTAQIQAGPYAQTPSGINSPYNPSLTSPYGPFTPMPTNLVAWSNAPNYGLNFFTNAADLLLRSQIFQFTNYLTNALGQLYTNSLGQYVQAGGSNSWIYTTFGITNIPVYMSNNPTVHYNEQIHRMLQLAANIYADANPYYVGTNQEPPIFRPLFAVTNQGTTNAALYIVGYTNVPPGTAYQQLMHNQDPWVDPTAVLSLTNTIRANDNVWGVPWIVGAVKGLPQFDQYSYQNRIFFDRKLLFVRQVSGGQVQTNEPPAYTNQFYEMSISNIFGMDAWNPYTNVFASSNGVYAVISNFITITITNNWNFGTNIYLTNTYNYGGGTFSNNFSPWQPSQFQTFFQSTNTPLPLGYFSEFSQAFPTFIPYTNYSELNTLNPGFLPVDMVQKTYPTHSYTVTTTNHVFYALFDGNPTLGNANVLDFVNLGPFGSSLALSQELLTNANNQNYNPQFPGEWVINNATDKTGSPLSQGVLTQIYDTIQNNSTNLAFYNSLNGNTPAIAGATFGPQAPYSTALLGPVACYTDSNIWLACDPLVHYTIGDLTWPGYTSVQPPPLVSPYTTAIGSPLLNSAGTITKRYTIGAANPNIVFGDPGVPSPDYWQFPTNLFPGIGWLGRVHRGTPWQTVYLKSDDPNPSLSYQNWYTQWVNNPFTYPTNDWSILDLFTAVPNDNAARGLLSVNQTNDAAWAAVFAGVIAITNGTPGFPTGGVPLNPTNDVEYIMDSAAGINAMRTNHVNGLFHHIGDILQSPALTVSPPEALSGQLTDEMVERIPQQTLSLLKVGLPQFVIYSWGQSLKPKNLYSSGSGDLLNICTNYEITGEYLTRTVCHIVGDPGASSPKIVIDNYNIMPGN